VLCCVVLCCVVLCCVVAAVQRTRGQGLGARNKRKTFLIVIGVVSSVYVVLLLATKGVSCC
jgi:hypothetical protein